MFQITGVNGENSAINLHFLEKCDNELSLIEIENIEMECGTSDCIYVIREKNNQIKNEHNTYIFTGKPLGRKTCLFKYDHIKAPYDILFKIRNKVYVKIDDNEKDCFYIYTYDAYRKKMKYVGQYCYRTDFHTIYNNFFVLKDAFIEVDREIIYEDVDIIFHTFQGGNEEAEYYKVDDKFPLYMGSWNINDVLYFIYNAHGGSKRSKNFYILFLKYEKRQLRYINVLIDETVTFDPYCLSRGKDGRFRTVFYMRTNNKEDEKHSIYYTEDLSSRLVVAYRVKPRIITCSTFENEIYYFNGKNFKRFEDNDIDYSEHVFLPASKKQEYPKIIQRFLIDRRKTRGVYDEFKE